MPYRIGCCGFTGEHERLGSAAFTGRNLFDGAARSDGPVLIGDRSTVLAFVAVAMLDQEPIVTCAALTVVSHAHNNPAALQLFPSEGEFQLPLSERSFGIAAVLGSPETAVPEHDRATAVLALRDGALEVPVIQRVVLDLCGEAPITRIERGTLRDRP